MVSDDPILDLKSDFVCEALDLACAHATWASKYLQDRQHARALSSFGSFLTAARAAADEMRDIRAKVDANVVLSQAASEWREENAA